MIARVEYGAIRRSVASPYGAIQAELDLKCWIEIDSPLDGRDAPAEVTIYQIKGGYQVAHRVFGHVGTFASLDATMAAADEARFWREDE